jgi:hypothetical protein
VAEGGDPFSTLKCVAGKFPPPAIGRVGIDMAAVFSLANINNDIVG